MSNRLFMNQALFCIIAAPLLMLSTPIAFATPSASAVTAESSSDAETTFGPLGDESVASPRMSTFMKTRLRYGVYPGGGTGETPNAPVPASQAVVARLTELSRGQPLNVHLYTAWSWYNPTDLDNQIQRYGAAGFKVMLTVKYSPPPGHNGDLVGFEAFVRDVVDRFGGLAAMDSFVIGNEANVSGNPDASDGAFLKAHAAVVRGVVAAHRELARRGSTSQVGMNFAITSADSDAAFLDDLAQIGGAEFTSSVQFIGIDLYPGIWPQGTGQPYLDTLNALESARSSIDRSGLRRQPIDIMELGSPIVDEHEQARRLTQFARAVLDNRERLRISSLSWFDLWDADSGAANPFAHYGLLHSDLSPKPSFGAFQQILAVGH